MSSSSRTGGGMLSSRRKPVVFAGASLGGLDERRRERIDWRPPVRRGDLERLLREERPGTAIIIDGIFGAYLSITPTECRKLLNAGWRVVGSSSMGALRASELWSVGMIGIGEIFTLFRLGTLRSDADVAVALNPKTFEEVTASVVHVRAVLSLLEQSGDIGGAFSRRLLLAARGIHWFERSWEDIVAVWGRAGLDPATGARALALARDPALNPKQRDARLAVACVLARRWVERTI
jgi:TfuA protein